MARAYVVCFPRQGLRWPLRAGDYLEVWDARQCLGEVSAETVLAALDWLGGLARLVAAMPAPPGPAAGRLICAESAGASQLDAGAALAVSSPPRLRHVNGRGLRGWNGGRS